MPRTRTLARKVVLAAAAMVSLNTQLFSGSLLLGVTTTWNNSTGNNLWGDPLNWSNGVPTFFDVASFPAAAVGTVDLGGVTRQASRVTLPAAGYTLQNGTLSASQIFGTAPTTIAANVGSGLSIINSTVTGSIFGPNYVELNNTTMAGNSPYTGSTFLRRTGTISGAGAATGTKLVYVTSDTGRLVLSYDDAGATNRLNDAGSVAFAMNARLSAINSGAAAVIENIGTLTSLVGQTSIDLHRATGSSGALTLTAADAIRQRGATLNVSLDADGGTALRFTAAPAQIGASGVAGTTTRSVVPWAMGVSVDRNTNLATGGLATYDAVDGLRPLNFATEYASTISAVAPTSNVRLTSPQILASPATANSLVIHDTTLSLNAGANLSLTSGALVLSSHAAAGSTLTAISGAGALNTPGELVVHLSAANNDTRFVVDAPIAAASLTKSGASTLVLTKPNSINGNITVNGGVLESAAAGALGAGTGTILLAGSGLKVTGASQVFGAVETVNPTQQQLIIPESSSATLGHPQDAFVDVAAGLTATFNGPFTGNGSFEKHGPGTLRLAAADNPFPGAYLRVLDGTLQIDGTFRGAPDPTGLALRPSVYPGFDALVIVTGIGTLRASLSGTDVHPGVNGPGLFTVEQLGPYGTTDSALTIDIDGATPITQYDQLVITNGATFTERALNIDLGFTPLIGQLFLIVDDQFAGAASGTFNNLPEGAVFGVGASFFQISYVGGNGNDVVLTSVIPEPALGGVILAGALWRDDIVAPGGASANLMGEIWPVHTEHTPSHYS